MNKISLGVLALMASSVAAASSAIVLPGGKAVNPSGTVSISLASLPKETHYNLTCQLSNPHAEAVDLRFEPTPASAQYGLVSLNETVLDNLQGSLKSGENTLIINELSVSGNASAALQFKNLDFGRAVQLGSCVALPSVKPNIRSGGSFIAYNDTSNVVEIKVGNFFPTPYTIYPHSSRWVFVSTNNQNITVSNIY